MLAEAVAGCGRTFMMRQQGAIAIAWRRNRHAHVIARSVALVFVAGRRDSAPLDVIFSYAGTMSRECHARHARVVEYFMPRLLY